MLYTAYNRKRQSLYIFFFFNDTATTEIYTLSLHDALPISRMVHCVKFGKELPGLDRPPWKGELGKRVYENVSKRSEEHTSELQSPCNLVCRLLLEKKKTNSWRARIRYSIDPCRQST